MLAYKDKFLTVEIDEIYNRMISLFFDIMYKD